MRTLVASCVAVWLLGCQNHLNNTADAGVDAPPGPMCTGQTFDLCTGPTQCMSMNCHFYNQAGFSVCTQTCTAGDNTTCPVDSTGVNGFCNNMGNCKPAAPNNCHL